MYLLLKFLFVDWTFFSHYYHQSLILVVVVGECREVELVVFLLDQLAQVVVVVWVHDGEGHDEILLVLILIPRCVHHHVPLCLIQTSYLKDRLLPLMRLHKEEIPQNECHSAY